MADPNPDRPVLHLVQRPQSVELDGTWHAWYPGLDMTATGDTRVAAIAALVTAYQDAETDPAFLERLFAVAQRAVDAPEPGLFAEYLTAPEKDSRIEDLAADPTAQAPVKAADPDH